MITERLKAIEYKRLYRNTYFWRTLKQQEIDYIEEYDGKLFAYEFTWNPRKKPKFPLSFKKAYPKADFKVISKDNFHTFINLNSA